MFSKKCKRFRFEHPFSSMIAGMTGSGKTAWVRSLLQQASRQFTLPRRGSFGVIHSGSPRIHKCQSPCHPLIDLKTTTQDNCRLRTKVLPSEEGFNQAGFQENTPHELLKYLKQQTLLPVPLPPPMQEIQGNMDDMLSRIDLRDDEKAKRYFQLQNRYLAF